MSLQYEVDSMKSDLKYKVEKTDLKDFREKIEKHYATLIDLEAIDGKFIEYAKVSMVREIEKDLENFKSFVNLNYTLGKDIGQRFNDFRNEVYDNFSQKEGVKNNFMNLERKMPILTSEISSLKGLIAKSEKEIVTIYTLIEQSKNLINTKCDLNELSRVSKMFNQYTTLEQLKDLNDKVISEVKRVEDLALIAQSDAHVLKDVVSRFDEVVNEKASKFKLQNIEQEIKKYPLKTNLDELKNDYVDKIAIIDGKIEEIESKMDIYKQNAMSNIEESIKLAVTHISRSVISVSSPKQIDLEDIINMINQKVDISTYKEDIAQLSTYTQLEKLSTVVDILHKQLKTTAVIQFEIIKNEIERLNTTSLATQNKNAFLQKQSINLDAWISTLNPLEFETVDTLFHLKVKDEVLRKLNPQRFSHAKLIEKMTSLKSISDPSIKQQILLKDFKNYDSPNEILNPKIFMGKYDHENDNTDMSKSMTIEQKRIDQNASVLSMKKHIAIKDLKTNKNSMNNTMEFISDQHSKNNSPRYGGENDMTKTANFLHEQMKSKEKIRKHFLKSVKHSVDIKDSNIKSISKIRIKNLGKRRDRSILNSKRLANESGAEVTPHRERNANGVREKISLKNSKEKKGNNKLKYSKEINNLTGFDDSSEDDNDNQGLPSINRHGE